MKFAALLGPLSPRQQRGDTIVEVLIAVAVVTSVLAGAFTVSQASSKAVRDSQERAEATQLLQGQIEVVRALALEQKSNTDGIYETSPHKYFCIRMSDKTRVHLDDNTLPDLSNDTFDDTVYGSECRSIKSSDGATTRYNVAITYDASNKVFQFTNRWDGIDGQKKQQTMSYRVHPGIATIAPPTVVSITGDAAVVPPPPTGGTACWRQFGWFAPGCWKPRIYNNTTSPQSIITQCQYAWYTDNPSQPPVKHTYPGSDSRCSVGGSDIHNYTPVGPAPPGDPMTANASGYYKFYKVILTNTFNNGSAPKSAAFTFRLPG
ncbi:MAG TPA: type II secretion system protein [Candidatus Limnocylindrales bacterium]|nr:type II secretion system protein [Candidatus Limnocylindrales bacterium]